MIDPRRSVKSEQAQRFGAEARRRREAKGKSLRGFADELGMDAASLSLLERGQQEPRYDHMRRIASGLGASLVSLIQSAERSGHGRRVPSRAA